MKKINVIIADDIQILRKGLNTILSASSSINVIGTAKMVRKLMIYVLNVM